MLDELEKGPWPSFVKEIRTAADETAMAADLIDQLEQSYEEKIGHWKHGGIVGVKGYGGGVVGRYTNLPDKYPNLAEFHTVRVAAPSGWFYTTDKLRQICDIWDKRGSHLTNVHGSSGDMILLGCKTEDLQPIFDELADNEMDLGGSGSDLRSPMCCVGPGYCEWACYDTLDMCLDVTNEWQDELHRPMWPYKSKIKMSGCANDCVGAGARADISVIGTWRDSITIDQDEVKKYVENGMDVAAVVHKCPTKCLHFDKETLELTVDADECTRCMHCINAMGKAIKQGKEKGASILVGAKSTIVKSANMSWVLVPFMKMESPYDEFKELVNNIWDWWDENGKTRERLGETIYRLGMGEFLRAIDMPAVPQMVWRPRANPYVFWQPEDFEKENQE